MYQLLIKDRNNLYQNVEIQEEGGFKISANEPLEFKFGRSIKTYTIKIMNNGHNNIVFDNIFYKNFEHKRVWDAKLKINEIYFEGLFKVRNVDEFELSGQFISGAGILWEEIGDTKLPDLTHNGESVWNYLNHTKTVENVQNPENLKESHGIVYDNAFRGLTKGESNKGMIFPWGEVEYQGPIKTPLQHWEDYYGMKANTRRNLVNNWGQWEISRLYREMDLTDLSTRNVKFRLKDFLEKGIFKNFDVEQKIWEDDEIYEKIYLDTNNIRRRISERDDEEETDFELENGDETVVIWEDVINNNKFGWDFIEQYPDFIDYDIYGSFPFLGEIESEKNLEWDDVDECYYYEAPTDIVIDLGFNFILEFVLGGDTGVYAPYYSHHNLIIEHLDNANNVIETICDIENEYDDIYLEEDEKEPYYFTHSTNLFKLKAGEKIKLKLSSLWRITSIIIYPIDTFEIDFTLNQKEFFYSTLTPWTDSFNRQRLLGATFLNINKGDIINLKQAEDNIENYKDYFIYPETSFHITSEPYIFVIDEELEGNDLVPDLKVRDFINELLKLFNIEFHFNFETKKIVLLNRQQSKDNIETYDFTNNIIEDSIQSELAEPKNFLLKYEKEDMSEMLSEFYKNLIENNIILGHTETKEIKFQFGFPYFKKYQTLNYRGLFSMISLEIYQNNDTEEYYYAGEFDLGITEVSDYSTEYNPRLSFLLYTLNNTTAQGDLDLIGNFVYGLDEKVSPTKLPMFYDFLRQNYFQGPTKYSLSLINEIRRSRNIYDDNFDDLINYYNNSKRIQFRAKIDHITLNNIYYMLGKDLTAYYYIGVDGYKGYYQITELNQINDDFYRVKAFEVIPQNAGELPPQPPGDYNCDFNNDFDNVGCEGLWYELTTDSNQAGAQTFGDGFYKVDDEVEVYTTGTFVLMPGIEVNFLHWKDELDNVVSEQPEFIYTMPALNKTLTAVYETIELPKLTIKSQNGGKVNYEIARPTGGELGATELGTVNPGEEKEWTNVPAGTTVKVTAVPNFGFEFTKFYKYILMPELVYENPHEFTLTGDDTLIEARFNLLIEGQQ